MIKEGITNENGELLFVELPSGNYELEEVVPDDCTSSLNGKLTINLAANTVETIPVVNTKITNKPDPDNDDEETDKLIPVISSIPQTGGRVDFNGLILMGLLSSLTGLYFICKRK